jgi:predicted transcriptional regulator
MSSMNDTVTTTITVDRDLWRRVRILAAREDKSAAQWVREALLLVVERSERA